jgi:polyphosphate kinase
VLVVRQESDGLRRYVHLSTGNYNAATARLYTDVGLLTCDPEIGEDASELFNSLSGFSRKPRYRRLAVAPVGSRGSIARRWRGWWSTCARRVELLFPVETGALREQLRQEVIEPALADTAYAYEMNADGTYARRQPPDGRRRARTGARSGAGRRQRPGVQLTVSALTTTTAGVLVVAGPSPEQRLSR